LLISHSTFEKVREIVKLRDVVRVQVKGVREPVSLYSVEAVTGPYNIQLSDTVDVPVRITEAISFRVWRIDENLVRPVERTVRITHLSENAAEIFSPVKITARDEIRMELLDDSLSGASGVLLAKIISVSEFQGHNEGTVRSAFVSPGLCRFFRSVARGEARKNS